MKTRVVLIIVLFVPVLILGCSNQDHPDQHGSSRFCGALFENLDSLEFADADLVSSRHHRYWARVDTYLASGRDSLYMHCLNVYERHNPVTTAYIRYDSTNLATLWALAPDFDQQMESIEQNPADPAVDSLILQQGMIFDSTQVPTHSFGGKLRRTGFIAWRLRDDRPILYLRFARQEMTVDPNAPATDSLAGIRAGRHSGPNSRQ